jgi:hypothetical protein
MNSGNDLLNGFWLPVCVGTAAFAVLFGCACNVYVMMSMWM